MLLVVLHRRTASSFVPPHTGFAPLPPTRIGVLGHTRVRSRGFAHVAHAHAHALSAGVRLCVPQSLKTTAAKGEWQADKMARYWAPIIKRIPTDNVRLYAGPMLGNLQVRNLLKYIIHIQCGLYTLLPDAGGTLQCRIYDINL